MKPLLINTFDVGGAANACIRLHKGLMNNNIDSKVLVKEASKNFEQVHQISITALQSSLRTKISKKSKNILGELNLYSEKPDPFISQRSFGLEMFSYPNSDYDLTASVLYKEATLVNLHWVARFLDYPSFFKKNTKPVVWTLHDQNPFSGGDHINEEFLGIDEKGLPIKRKLSKIERKVFKENLAIKKEALQPIDNLNLVVLSSWMQNEVNKSELFSNYNTTLIPNGLDSTIFKPSDKNFCRELLDIPLDKKVILFVSDLFSRQLKGFEFMKRAMLQIKNKDVLFLSVGGGFDEPLNNNNHKHIGFINDEKLMSVVYSAADAFVIPSLMDNLPNTVMESIMCGTPVIGFPVGGIKDMIKDNLNGHLTDEISVASLADGINDFLNKSDSFDTDAIRKDAVERYDLSIQVNAYINLYQSLIT
ncbi:Glycosyltransferase involved in cell wall bisynthesis [Flavobacteriaceae bacterium MAR_2010_188]|nr:Glycosyltransferase involved in cell wall bisynthesis [Flavobacteriaceae bacterium MAR_2010_188]